MCGPTSLPQIAQVVQIISGLAGTFGAIKGMSGGGSKGGGEIQMPAAPSPPAAKSEQPDKTNFGAQPGALSPPTFLGINSSLSPEQQRSRIATMALSGDDAGFRGQEAQDYYRNVAQRSLTDPTGAVLPGASPLPIERQYATQVLGRSFRGDSTENFLTQLLSP